MKKEWLYLGLVLFLALVLFSCSKGEKKVVVATVGDRTITMDEIDAQFGNFPTIEPGPALKRKKDILERLIESKLLLLGAYQAGLDKDSTVLKGLDTQKEGFLLQALYNVEIANKAKVTDSEIKDYYEKTGEEIRASHILVPDEAKAKELYEKIKQGADFAQLAKENSLDKTSGEKGGDLGFFSWGRMVPEFQEAAFKLKAGEISQPVKTQFGWHIIKVEERRPVQKKELKEIKEEITQSLQREKQGKLAQKYLEDLEKNSKMEIVPQVLDLIISKGKEILPSDTALIQSGISPAFAKEKYTEEERKQILTRYKGGELLLGSFIDNLNMFYLPYNPDLKPEDKEGMEKIIKQLLQAKLLAVDAKKKNVEKKKEYQELYDNAKESMMFNTMKRKLDQEIQLTNEEVQAYYEQKKDSYKTLATIHLQEIFVKTEGEAKDVLKKLKGGANFTKLAKEKTLRNPFKDKGGDLGFVNRNQFPVLFDSTIQRKTGEIVGPIHFQDYTLGDGWAVVKLLEKKESQIQPLDEIKDKVKQMALNEKRQKNFQDWIEAKKKEIKIEIKEDVLEKSVQKDTTKASQG